MHSFFIFLPLLPLLVACSDSQTKQTHKAPSMKCGAGKCGANMFDSNGVLAKKKKNILSQMRKDDPRKTCVVQAPTTKALYDCVRNPQNGRLTRKCGMQTQQTMKCGEGKCGSAMR